MERHPPYTVLPRLLQPSPLLFGPQLFAAFTEGTQSEGSLLRYLSLLLLLVVPGSEPRSSQQSPSGYQGLEEKGA